MNFPVYIRYKNQTLCYTHPVQFQYGEGEDAVGHSLSVWHSWTQEDWQTHCPEYVFLTLVDAAPVVDDTKIVTQLPTEHWEVEGDHLEVRYLVTDKTNAQIDADNKELIKSVAAAVQQHMDMTVKARNYDSILSACTYATSSIPKYKAEGQACVEWRDAIWITCFSLMEEVANGTRPKMTPAEVVASLPSLTWPTV